MHLLKFCLTFGVHFIYAGMFITVIKRSGIRLLLFAMHITAENATVSWSGNFAAFDTDTGKDCLLPGQKKAVFRRLRQSESRQHPTDAKVKKLP